MTNQTPQGDPEVLKRLGASHRGAHRALRRWAPVAVLVALIGATAGWYFTREKEATHRFVTAPAERGDLRETVSATGTLSPVDAVEVGAEVTGRVLAVKADINDRVTKGQVLVEIDTETLRARIEESQAQLSSAAASHKNAKATLSEAESKAARSKELHTRGLTSTQELEAAEAALDRAKASVGVAAAQITVAQAGLKSAQTNLSKTIILSPIDGIVLSRSVEPGQTVTSGFQTPVLFTLARDLTELELAVDIDEADVGKVRPDEDATFVVDAYPNRKFKSKVTRLSNLPKTGTTVVTYEALLTVNNAELLLRPGMTATATIVTSEKKGVLTVPNAALRFTPPTAAASSAGAKRGGGIPLPGLGGPRFRPPGTKANTSTPAKRDRVYVLRDGVPAPITVEVGSTDGRRTEVRSPELRPGAEVITDYEETSK